MVGTFYRCPDPSSPPFVEIGANSVVGLSAVLSPHVIERDRLAQADRHVEKDG